MFTVKERLKSSENITVNGLLTSLFVENPTRDSVKRKQKRAILESELRGGSWLIKDRTVTWFTA